MLGLGLYNWLPVQVVMRVASEALYVCHRTPSPGDYRTGIIVGLVWFSTSSSVICLSNFD